MKILITGAASGIGRACVAFYAGHEVVGIDKEELDLSDIDAVCRYLDSQNDFDVLIYCAGIREIAAPHTLSYNAWQRVIDINLTANFILSKGLIKNALDKKRKLTIVNIASVSGFQAEPDRGAYVTSKYALIGLTKQLAYQYGKEGIRVNAIAPGIIETPLTETYFNNAKLINQIKADIPVGHWGQVENVISLIDVCIQNNYVNGSVLVCDGGWTIGRKI